VPESPVPRRGIDPPDAARVLKLLKEFLGSTLPSVSEIARSSTDPFQILVSTMISLRTKDEVTLAASRRLFGRAPDAGSVARLSVDEIAALIFPCGFYRTKAANIKKTAQSVVAAGGVPRTREELVALPGVGPKTASLTLGLGFGVPAICVDTHVHRISNRIGWVQTASPEATETALESVVPRRLWIETNEILVAFGQRVCTPQSPRCSECPAAERCPKIGVIRSR
jgi:endonuclease III